MPSPYNAAVCPPMKMDLALTYLVLIFASKNAFSLGLQVSCSDDKMDCNYFITDSSCINEFCECDSGNVLSGDASACLAVAGGYGGDCSDSTQCVAPLGPGGACIGNLCQCNAGFHYLKGRCWKSIGLNQPCFQDEQCFAGYDFTGLHCQGGVCACRSEFYARAGACRRRAYAGDSCIFDSDCACANGKCSTRICQCSDAHSIPSYIDEVSVLNNDARERTCDPGYFDVNGECFPEIGSSCENNNDCKPLSSAICIDNRSCGCDILRIRSANNRACTKVAAFNGVCASDEVCSPFGASSYCADNNGKKLCACREGSRFLESEQYCIVKRVVGDGCQIDAECFTTSGTSAECTNNICSCVAGTHEAADGQDCRPDGLHVGDPCIEDADCMFENGKCNSNSSKCACDDYYFASEQGKCILGVGGSCSDNIDCKNAPGSICSESSTCQCEGNAISALDFSTCLPIKDYGESCLQRDQCNTSMGDLKECKSGNCTCQDEAQFLFSRCYAIKRLGEKCKARAECIHPGDIDRADSYLCQNGVCVCQYEHTQSGERCI